MEPDKELTPEQILEKRLKLLDGVSQEQLDLILNATGTGRCGWTIGSLKRLYTEQVTL